MLSRELLSFSKPCFHLKPTPKQPIHNNTVKGQFSSSFTVTGQARSFAVERPESVLDLEPTHV